MSTHSLDVKTVLFENSVLCSFKLTKFVSKINTILKFSWFLYLLYLIKRELFQAVALSVLLYCCTTWTLIKCLEKKLEGNYTRVLHAIFNKSWKKFPTKQHLYSHLSLITQAIQVRQIRHAEHCWRYKEQLISDILQ